MANRSLVIISFVLGLFLFPSCKKGSSNPPTSEANLVVQTNPGVGSFQPPAIEPFNLTVTITSTMPPSGVKIDVSAKREDNSSTFYTESRNTTSASNNFTITNTPVGVQCIVEIKVTSLSKSSNQWTGSYHYSRKS
jgi:hypothetical protein